MHNVECDGLEAAVLEIWDVVYRCRCSCFGLFGAESALASQQHVFVPRHYFITHVTMRALTGRPMLRASLSRSGSIPAPLRAACLRAVVCLSFSSSSSSFSSSSATPAPQTKKQPQNTQQTPQKPPSSPHFASIPADYAVRLEEHYAASFKSADASQLRRIDHRARIAGIHAVNAHLQAREFPLPVPVQKLTFCCPSHRKGAPRQRPALLGRARVAGVRRRRGAALVRDGRDRLAAAARAPRAVPRRQHGHA
jgi:hypothetical protein